MRYLYLVFNCVVILNISKGYCNKDSIRQKLTYRGELGTQVNQGFGTFYNYFVNGSANNYFSYGVTLSNGILVRERIYCKFNAAYQNIDGQSIFPLSLGISPILLQRKRFLFLLDGNYGYAYGKVGEGHLDSPFFPSELKSHYSVGIKMNYLLNDRIGIIAGLQYTNLHMQSYNFGVSGLTKEYVFYKLHFLGASIGISY